MPARTDTRLKNPVAIPPGESSITAGEWFKKLILIGKNSYRFLQ
jgi:hypothetical protein